MINGSYVMEDTMSEDTMMECGEDSNDFINAADNTVNSVPTIKDAAEKLLTLLQIDSDDDLLSLSEDEGVETDMSDDEDPNELNNYRLVFQLAISLAQEQRCSRKHGNDFCKSPQQNHRVDLLANQYSAPDAFPADDSEAVLRRLNAEKQPECTNSWLSGWDDCAAEAVRYLVDVEGLSVYDPSVLAMKNHLDIQRKRLITPFAT